MHVAPAPQSMAGVQYIAHWPEMQKLFPPHSSSEAHGIVQPPMPSGGPEQNISGEHWLLSVQGPDKSGGPGKHRCAEPDALQCPPGQSAAVVQIRKQVPPPQ
jgi:hypothetical protein